MFFIERRDSSDEGSQHVSVEKSLNYPHYPHLSGSSIYTGTFGTCG